MRLSDYAKKNGCCYRTAWSHYKSGKIQGLRISPTGRIVIDENPQLPLSNRAIIYSRVSTHKQKQDLDNQSDRLINYAVNKGYQIHKNLKEIASGLNENRKYLNQILEDDDFDILIVEYKDRLARFGFNYIEKILKNKNKIIEIVNIPETDKEDIVNDLISIVTCFCAKIYSRRKIHNIKSKILEITKEED